MADLDKAQQIYDSMSAEQKAQFQKQYGGEQKAQDFLQSQNTNQTQNTVKTQSTPTPKQEIQPQKAPTATTQQGRPELLPESYYKDDTDRRQNEIITNLNQAVYQNPQSLSDYNTFANYYNYEGRTDLQKQTLDNRYLGYQKSQEYSTKSVKELQSLYNANVISQNDLSILKMYDPNKYNELNSLITKTADLKTYADQLSGTEITTPTNPFQGIIDNFIQGLESFSQTNFYDEYRDTINSPALKQKNQEIIAEQAEMERIDLLIKNKRKDVEERYAGTGATKSKIAAIIADETYELQLDKANRAITLNAMVNSYNAELNNAKEELGLKIQEYNLNIQQKEMQMKELGFITDLMNFETNAQKDERAWNNFIREQEYKDGNIYSQDVATRRKAVSNAVDNVLAEFAGIPMPRSREKMIEDIWNLVENQGMSLGEAITKNIREPIMNTSEYKQRHSQTFGEKAPQIYNVGGNDYVWNEKTGAFESVPTYEGPTGMSEFIGRWEGFRENAYQDVGGVWTIGYGFTKVNGVPVKAGDKITREQADVEFQKQISQYQNWRNYITTPLSEAQETALTSFEYNLGQGIWTKSVGGAMGVIDSINNGDLQGAADLMKKFNKAKIDGVLKEVKGLSNRRNEEAQLLMQTGPSIVGGVEVTGFGGETPARRKDVDISNLSTEAQAARNAGQLVGTSTQKFEIIKEFQEKGFFDLGLGNAGYFQATESTRKDLGNLKQGYNSWQEFMNVYNSLSEDELKKFTGWFDARLKRGKEIVDIDADPRFSRMSTILAKELSAYMKDISGTAVSDKEANRLSKQIPNLKSGLTKFKEDVGLYNRSMENALAYASDSYGLGDNYWASYVEIPKATTKQTAPTSGYDFSGLSNGGPIKTGYIVINGVEYNLDDFS